MITLRTQHHAVTFDTNSHNNIPANPHKVLFSGDSISDGWHASIKSKGFVYLVENALTPEQSIHTHRHGYTVGQVGEKFDIPANVDLAIVELGTNDVNWGTTYEAFSLNYPHYLDRVMSKSPKAALICLGVFPNSTRAQDFDKIIQSSCANHGGRFVKISDLYSDQRAVGPVGRQTWAGPANLGHPNDYGHAQIAHRIMTTIREQG